MQSGWKSFKREMSYLRVAVLRRHPFALIAFVLGLGLLAFVCAYGHFDPVSEAQPAAHRPGVPAAPAPTPPEAPAPVLSAAAERNESSAELLLRLAQVLCCTSIEFEENGASLTARGKRVLDDLVPLFAEHSKAHLYIDGHTDSAGSPQAARDLSLARATAARDYLIARGVREQQLSARGFGGEQPLADNNTEDGRSRNRRIEFRL